MEALSQNNVKPFEKSREEATFATVSFMPPKKKKKKGNKKKKSGAVESPPEVVEPTSFNGEDPMMEAVKNGWAPGIPFSFEAKIKGQVRRRV